ncbi:MAG: hypothetical protein MZU97_02145 [Bacillus subtilis]|nr:hypothetical protein [Bacillus subtilis]
MTYKTDDLKLQFLLKKFDFSTKKFIQFVIKVKEFTRKRYQEAKKIIDAVKETDLQPDKPVFEGRTHTKADAIVVVLENQGKLSGIVDEILSVEHLMDEEIESFENFLASKRIFH